MLLSGAQFHHKSPRLFDSTPELLDFLRFCYAAEFFRRWLPVGIAVEPRAGVLLDDSDGADYPGTLLAHASEQA